MRHSDKSCGFTVMELMITLAILATLALMTLPNMKRLIESNRMLSAKNALIASLQQARADAASTTRNNVLCPSANGRQCLTAGDWSKGWLLYRDDNRNGRFDPVESLLHVFTMDSSNLTVRTSDGRRKVTYRNQGRADGANARFVFCDARGESFAGQVVIANSGRIRTTDKVPVGACG